MLNVEHLTYWDLETHEVFLSRMIQHHGLALHERRGWLVSVGC